MYRRLHRPKCCYEWCLVVNNGRCILDLEESQHAQYRVGTNAYLVSPSL